MQEEEQILVVPRGVFEEVGAFQGFSGEAEKYLPKLLEGGTQFFMSRSMAEEDPSHKQLIPYCILHCQGKYLHYHRGKSGGESRLHAKGSIGIGGHINPVDASGQSLGREAYFAAVARELDEELAISVPFDPGHVVGLINDDSTAVGQVHLGLVHMIELEKPLVEAGEEAISNLTWRKGEELKGSLYEALEGWSQICADALL